LEHFFVKKGVNPKSLAAALTTILGPMIAYPHMVDLLLLLLYLLRYLLL